MTDFRALCIELADAYLRTLEHINNSTWLGYEPSDDLLLQRTRAALAEPGPERPTDEELLEMMPQPFRDDLALVSRMAAHGAGPDIKPGLFRVSLNTGALDYARAVLSRWGNRPGILGISITPPPELVEEWIAQVWHEGTPVRVAASDLHVATQAARWGAAHALPLPSGEVGQP